VTVYDFPNTVKRILGQTMFQLGYVIRDEDDAHIAYVDDRSVISLSYTLEELPTPWLSVTVGLSGIPVEALRPIALWRAYPDVPELQVPATMEFNSQQSLVARIERVRDDWLPKLILPLFVDDSRLWAAWGELSREINEEGIENARQMLVQQIRRARQRFDTGDYEGAIQIYAACSPASLTAADRRRFAMARKLLMRG
jgi:hypothetical protein